MLYGTRVSPSLQTSVYLSHGCSSLPCVFLPPASSSSHPPHVSHEYQSTARANAWYCISTCAPMLGMFVSYWPCAAHFKMRLWRRAVRISSTSAKRHRSIAEWAGWSTYD